ncbi:MAG: DNA adenine methylase, partial [Bacteroidales bacterium]
MKNYTSAPLPFSGQKRRFAGKFKESLKEVAPNSIVVDLFGGSGLLSHFAKTALPNARVIYNDFDNYTLRLKNIENTNKLLSMIRHLLGSTPGKHKIPSEIKNKILDLLKENEDSGMIVDYHTISSNLMFSNNISLNFDEFRLHNLYNNISKNDYNCEGYLKGVEVVSVDYKVLFNKYKENENVFFIFDPPYLNTLVESYAMNGWSLAT